MSLQTLRLNKGWSQEHLASVSGVSVRTIQRLENGANAAPDSLQALAAAFDVEVSDLTTPARTTEVQDAYAEHLRGFRANWISAVIVIPCLALFSWLVTHGTGWVIYVLAGWGLGIALHAALVFLVYRPADQTP